MESDESSVENAERNGKNVSSPASTSFRENQFILVNYTYKGGGSSMSKDRLYVGRIISYSGYHFTVKFLRSYAGRRNEFVFPPVADIDDIRQEDIVEKSSEPTEKRGRFIFTKNII